MSSRIAGESNLLLHDWGRCAPFSRSSMLERKKPWEEPLCSESCCCATLLVMNSGCFHFRNASKGFIDSLTIYYGLRIVLPYFLQVWLPVVQRADDVPATLWSGVVGTGKCLQLPRKREIVDCQTRKWSWRETILRPLLVNINYSHQSKIRGIVLDFFIL